MFFLLFFVIFYSFLPVLVSVVSYGSIFFSFLSSTSIFATFPFFLFLLSSLAPYYVLLSMKSLNLTFSSSLAVVLCCAVVGSSASLCIPPAHVPNGHVTLGRGGFVASFRCHDGHTLQGTAVAVCVAGRWSTPPPTCLPAGKN